MLGIQWYNSSMATPSSNGSLPQDGVVERHQDPQTSEADFDGLGAIARPSGDPAAFYFSAFGNDLTSSEDTLLHQAPQKSALVARALLPFSRARTDEVDEFIDPQIASMMLASEAALARNGDLWEAFNARVDLGGGPLLISHPDEGVEQAYRDWFQAINIQYILEDAELTRCKYGNAYTVFLGDREQSAVTNLNPKKIAVGSARMGKRAIRFFPSSRDPQDLVSEFYMQRVLSPEWNEWKEYTDGGMRLNPERVIHSHVRKLHQERYGIPPMIRAWDNLMTRTVLGELVRSTAEDLKTQIRLFLLENPMRGEATKLVTEIKGGRSNRAYDLVWRNNLKVEVIVPGTVDALMATGTWMHFTMNVFRDLGMFMRPVSGEASSDRGSERGVEYEVLIYLSRLKREQRISISIAERLARLYSLYGDPGLKDKGAPALRIAPSVLSQETAIDQMVKLMNYGIVDARTVHESVGLDHETVMKRLIDEKRYDPETGMFMPYAGYSQGGPTGFATHQQSQGRPENQPVSERSQEANKENARE